MDFSSLEKYLLQCLNMALDSNSTETSYTNSFTIQVEENGFKWIPRMPTTLLINDSLYQKIYEISSIALYPRYTLLKENGEYIIPEKIDDIHVERSLFFPWQKGIPQRIQVSNLLDNLSNSNDQETIPLMKNLILDYNKVTSIAIAGNSGSGKSYFLTYLLTLLNLFSDLIIIDPKMDSPARWAREFDVKALFPLSNRSKSDFISQINDELSLALNIIYQRQRQLYANPRITFKNYTIVIDEVLALTEGVNTSIKGAFYALLTQIALMGRATNVHLILVSQRFDHNTIPVSVREQLNVLIQLGNINAKTTQFLFPDFDPSGIVIPPGKGTGLIQIIDDIHPYQVQPFLAPTYNLEGITI
jgi:hypothetical protein